MNVLAISGGKKMSNKCIGGCDYNSSCLLFFVIAHFNQSSQSISYAHPRFRNRLQPSLKKENVLSYPIWSCFFLSKESQFLQNRVLCEKIAIICPKTELAKDSLEVFVI